MKTSSGDLLYIRLVGSDDKNRSAIPLTDLSTSLIGIERVLEDFAKICRLNGEIVLTANPPEEGSFVIGICLDLKLGYGQLPFEHISHLLEFLKISSETALNEAHSFFKELNNIRGGLNLYFEKHSFESFLLALVAPKLFDIAKKMKRSPLPPDDKTPKRIAKELHNMIKRNRFKRFIWPIVNDTVGSIEISPNRDFRNNASRIDNDDFDQLLGKDNEILPELVNSEIYDMVGTITSLKNTRGDILTFRYTSQFGTYNLVLYPPDGIDTRHYIRYYKECVVIKAKVYRTSLYKKPNLKMMDMTLSQPSLLKLQDIHNIADLRDPIDLDYNQVIGQLPHRHISKK